jgi:hypothetical protein
MNGAATKIRTMTPTAVTTTGARLSRRLGLGDFALGPPTVNGAGAEEPQQRGHEGGGHEDCHDHRAGGGEAHDGEEGNVDDGQGDQGDEYGQAGETHGGTRGRHCSACCLFTGEPTDQELPVSIHDEQRVVDTDGQPDH